MTRPLNITPTGQRARERGLPRANTPRAQTPELKYESGGQRESGKRERERERAHTDVIVIVRSLCSSLIDGNERGRRGDGTHS